MFERKLYKSLQEHIDKRPVTIITGMRRTGKTTSVKQFLAEMPSRHKLFMDFERVDSKEIFRKKL